MRNVMGLCLAALLLLGGPPAATAAQAPIKIGFFGPLTGSVAADGISARLAVELAAQEVNGRGGLLGRPVELVVYDDRPHAAGGTKLLLEEIPNICFRCHSKNKIMGQKVKHPSVESAMCMTCHQPHQSDFKRLLRDKMPNLCFNCHDSTLFNTKVIHPVVTSGLCMECHEPHTANKPALLDVSVNEICLKCHPRIARAPHAIGGFTGAGHLLNGKKTYEIDGK